MSKIVMDGTPKYNLEKIKFAVDNSTYTKAIGLYESGKIKNFDDNGFTYTANVYGTELYNVVVSSLNFASGSCDCYVGQNDTLCKHMVAVAIMAVLRGETITESDKNNNFDLICSNKKGELNTHEFKKYKSEISVALKYIKSYGGPSKHWFKYQNSLNEGVNRISVIVSKLPVSLQTAKLLVDLALRLDRKLVEGGIDDSNGTVGGLIQGIVGILKDFEKIDKDCGKAFLKLKGIETCFGWEDELIDTLRV